MRRQTRTLTALAAEPDEEELEGDEMVVPEGVELGEFDEDEPEDDGLDDEDEGDEDEGGEDEDEGDED